VLLVCTGNICRSALAERLGRAYLADALGDDAEQIQLVSAGTRAVTDSAMHPDSALVLEGLGGRPDGFAARQLHEHVAIDADLVLTMTRAHRREVLKVAPRALARTFTLREAAALLDDLDGNLELPGEGMADRARALVKELAAVRSQHVNSNEDDIRDPIGESVEVHAEVGEAIAAALVPILGRLAALDIADPMPTEPPDPIG